MQISNHDTNLLLELVEDELHHHIVLHLQHLVDPLGDPGLQNVHLDFGHVDLLHEILFKLHGFQQLLLLVRKAIVLIGTGALLERNVSSIFWIYMFPSLTRKNPASAMVDGCPAKLLSEIKIYLSTESSWVEITLLLDQTKVTI